MAAKATDQEAPPDLQQLKYKTWALKVSIHCEGCKRKVKKVLQGIDGVYKTDIDSQQHKVIVTGNVESDTLLKQLGRYGKHAELWPENPETQTKKKKKKKKNKSNNGNGSQNQPGQEPSETTMRTMTIILPLKWAKTTLIMMKMMMKEKKWQEATELLLLPLLRSKRKRKIRRRKCKTAKILRIPTSWATALLNLSNSTCMARAFICSIISHQLFLHLLPMG